MDAAAALRRRGAENLFAPDREGGAAAVELNLHARLTGRSSAHWDPRGGEWSASSARLVGWLRL